MPCLFFPDMRFRSFDKEMMDLPDADTEKLLRTIREFKLLNILFSAGRKIIRRHFFSLMKQDRNRSYTLLDIGAGGCDIAVWAVREARRLGIRLSVTALDADARIIPAAMEAVRDYPEITVVRMKAADIDRLNDFDFIFSNHFLHHLDWDEIEILLGKIALKARLAFVMNDLRRSAWAYFGYSIFTGLFFHKSFALNDGRLSIRRGFKESEMNDFLQKRLPGLPVRAAKAFPARLIIFKP